MIVLQNADHANLVNVILRPIKGLAVSSETVQYYIYRGLLKSSFVNATGTTINPKGTAGNSDFLERFWTNWDNYVAETLHTGGVPTPRAAFAFDEISNLSNEILIESIFNNSILNTRAIKVSAGEWIGEFDSTNKIVFEVIINSNHIDFDPNNPDYLRMDLGYARKAKHLVDVTNIDAVSGTALTPEQKAFKLKVRREEILSYMDPAAFYGLFFYKGIKEVWNDGGTWKKRRRRKQALYSNIISKFETKDRVYIDIRGEYGFSYNFYDNYQVIGLGGTNDVLMVKSDSAPAFREDEYYSHEWPIFYTASWVSTNPKNRIKLKFRVGDENPNPVLYIDNPKLKGLFKKEKFHRWDDLPVESPNPNPDWTEPITLKFPNVAGVGGSAGQNIATYIRLQYFHQQKYAGAFPTKVLKSEHNLDTVFGGLELPSIDGISAVFKHNKSQKLQYVRGDGFGYAAYPESYQDDSNNIFFFTEIEYANKKRNSQRPKKKFKGNAVTESAVFPQNMAFTKVEISENNSGTFSPVFILNLSENISTKKKSTHIEDVFALGLIKSEYDDLVAAANTANLSNKHPRLFVFEVESHLPEQNGVTYGKYKLSLQGLDTSGNLATAAPLADIFVYTTDEQIFSTNAFSTASNIPLEKYHDPAYIKQWNHVGTAHYKSLNNSLLEIPDLGSNSGLIAPSKISLNAQVYFPADMEGVKSVSGISSVEPSYPIVAMVHGNGHQYEDYDRVLKHLARNGFIATSVDCTLIRDEFVFKRFNN